MLKPQMVTDSVLGYIKTLDLCTRWKLSKDLGSQIVYGEKGFGDKEKLAQAKKENKHNLDLTKTYEAGPVHHVVMANLDEDDQSVNAHVVEVVTSSMSLSEFLGKDFIVDISPEKVFVIFPDLTFIVSTKAIKDLSWEEWRMALELQGLLDVDLEGYTESLVSLDVLRRKIKDETITELELRELRKKFYGFAYAIDKQIKTI